MKGIIVYKSAYGCTAEYAGWLQEDIHFDLVDQKDAGKISWSRYDIIILGSPVLMNKPFLSKWIVENWFRICHAKVFLFTTSGAPPQSPALSKGCEEAIPGSIRQKLNYFPLPGRFNYQSLNFPHRMMMQIGAMIQKSREERTRMRRDMQRGSDNVERMALLPLITAVKNQKTLKGEVK